MNVSDLNKLGIPLVNGDVVVSPDGHRWTYSKDAGMELAKSTIESFAWRTCAGKPVALPAALTVEVEFSRNSIGKGVTMHAEGINFETDYAWRPCLDQNKLFAPVARPADVWPNNKGKPAVALPAVHEGAELVYANVDVKVLHAIHGKAAIIHSKSGEMEVVDASDLKPRLTEAEADIARTCRVVMSQPPVEGDNGYDLKIARELIDAGYKKVAPMNREFTKGGGYPAGDVFVSGSSPEHADTKEGVELLRDEVSERLS